MPTIKIHYFSDDLPRLQKTGKGDWIVRVAHADAASPVDGKYALEHSSANVGAISFARTALSVKKSAGAVALTVNRSSAEGKVRVRYGTVNGTAQPGVDYVAQQGELVWENGDRKAKTITVRLIPDLVPEDCIFKTFEDCTSYLRETLE